jgi:hypothetical protein
MNNNKIHYYLPHLVQMDYPETGRYYPCPYLYPISCLTETIIHNGKEEIPLVELAKIEGKYDGTKYLFNTKDDIASMWGMIWKIDNDDDHFTHCIFAFDTITNSFGIHYRYNGIENTWDLAHNQLLLFEYCYSRRINIWGIDAIDPRSLGDINPYLITSKK